jgi:competence protein CoiA
MLSAKRQSDGKTVTAYFESKRNAPFLCLDCNEEVSLKVGKSRINYFAHSIPRSCRIIKNESDEHRRCKVAIAKGFGSQPYVIDVILERPLGVIRPDVSAIINGIKVAIEIQVSSLSVETIIRRTIEYHRKGIYVLWLLQWTPKLDSKRYSPEIWEKWLHAAYFGRVYYWLRDLTVVSYSFEPSLKSVPKTSWYSKNGEKMSAGGYTRRSKRYRTPVRGPTLNLATDFFPKDRFWWEGNGVKVPDAKLYMDNRDSRN